MDRKVTRVCKAVSRRLVGHGAEAVVLFGSWVRNEAYSESDLDIHAIGRGPRYRLERCQDFLVSVSWATARQHRQAFKDPSKVGGIILCWRNAVVIYDAQSIAEGLKEEAQRWRWECLEKQTDRWVAEELTGYAEEVHKLVGNLHLGRRSTASVQRSLLAIHMAPILAVHHRILYDSENRLWELVSAKMGTGWTKVQNAALGMGDQNFEETCRAALHLFALASREIEGTLNKTQHDVVAHACEIAGYPLRKSGSKRFGRIS